jgi:hypothetical protein
VLNPPDEGTGANGSPPNGSDSNLSEDFCKDSLNFRLENGSKESSRFSFVDETGANGSDPGVEKGFDGLGHAVEKRSLLDVVAVKGSVNTDPADNAGSEVRPKAAVTGAVKGSSFSKNGSPPAMSKGSPYRWLTF